MGCHCCFWKCTSSHPLTSSILGILSWGKMDSSTWFCPETWPVLWLLAARGTHFWGKIQFLFPVSDCFSLLLSVSSPRRKQVIFEERVLQHILLMLAGNCGWCFLVLDMFYSWFAKWRWGFSPGVTISLWWVWVSLCSLFCLCTNANCCKLYWIPFTSCCTSPKYFRPYVSNIHGSRCISDWFDFTNNFLLTSGLQSQI